jgi:magnesium transporter
MEIPTIKWSHYQWIHLTSFNQQLADQLQDTYGFHELDLADCLAGKAQQPKREHYSDYDFFILHFPIDYYRTTKTNPQTKVSQLNIFIRGNLLVTLTNQNLPQIDKLYQSIDQDSTVKNAWQKAGPGELLYNIIDQLTDHSLQIVYRFGKHINTIDNDLLQLKRQVIESISLTRRNLIITSTTVKPMVRIFNELEQTQVDYLNGSLSEYWGNIGDHFKRMAELLADDAELLDGLTDAFDILLTHRTNQVIKVLTLFSVIMLPLTLISGIYGMNIQLPLAHQPFAFLWLAGLMLVVSIGMITFFKLKQWI